MCGCIAPFSGCIICQSGGGTWIVKLAGGWSGRVRDLVLQKQWLNNNNEITVSITPLTDEPYLICNMGCFANN